MTQRANGEGSLSKTSTGKWKASVSYRDGSGKLRRKSQTSQTKSQAMDFIRNESHLRDNGGLVTQTTESVAGFLDYWLKNVVETELAPKTLADYTLIVNKHIKPRIGRKHLTKLTPEDIQMMLSGMRREGVGDRTRVKAYAVLSSAMSKAVMFRRIPLNICAAVQRPKSEPEPISPFTVDEVKRLIESADTVDLRAIITIAVHTGMRQGELFGLEWSHIDNKNMLIDVKQQLVNANGKLQLTSTKSSSGRRKIKFNETVKRILVELKADHMRRGLLDSPIVFCSSSGTHQLASNFRKRYWLPLFQETGIPHRGFHHLRHSYATLQLSNGVPINIVSKVLGHKDAAFTLRTYIHVLDNMQDQAAETILKALQ
ncbi:Putative prophage phiRv2 integrase [Polystyrenella longa]|uniref:Prophage phiRv2 integrase n=1 Tax=Polystyrenella longa TaxID=2528007 RepID=A0A518CU18_9PLAN|nr:site-specific integrase [Polystyrenella longa]QDU82698.1 Putative prophage phiRv2 integrase [Polystyrenella longa]